MSYSSNDDIIVNFANLTNNKQMIQKYIKLCLSHDPEIDKLSNYSNTFHFAFVINLDMFRIMKRYLNSYQIIISSFIGSRY